MKRKEKPRFIGELRKSGYQVLSVKDEIRRNLLDKIKRGEVIFQGIIGYEDSVISQIVNSLIAGHDIIFLGERGQAKTKIIRSLVNLLDEEIPMIAGCEINDNPYAPICSRCKRLVSENGDSVEISWLGRDERFGEKLATPDTTVSDLIGDIDPIKVAEGKLLSDPDVIHYGLLPRTNRGIFAINELPDLSERIQVSLFNIMEERDIQIRGYKLRLPLDLLIVASANPEDYTARGRIVSPLKDRFDSLIRTHYPRSRELEIEIALQEMKKKTLDGITFVIPEYISSILSELTLQARKSEEINQHSGVSVRMTIANFEIIAASAQKRAYLLAERYAVPRMSDLCHISSSSVGKIEVDSFGEKSEYDIIDRLLKKSVRIVFDEKFKVYEFERFVSLFLDGFTFEVSDMKPSSEYVLVYHKLPELGVFAERLVDRDAPEFLASSLEFFLEGLYLHNRLSKEKISGRTYYSSRAKG